MTTAIWLAVFSALVSIVATLGTIAYRDITRRLAMLEKQQEKVFAAVLTLLISKTQDPVAVANALHGLITSS